jgi:hypothetical protein
MLAKPLAAPVRTAHGPRLQFAKIHKSIKTTPTMTDLLWSMEDIVLMAETKGLTCLFFGQSSLLEIALSATMVHDRN